MIENRFLEVKFTKVACPNVASKETYGNHWFQPRISYWKKVAAKAVNQPPCLRLTSITDWLRYNWLHYKPLLGPFRCRVWLNYGVCWLNEIFTVMLLFCSFRTPQLKPHLLWFYFPNEPFCSTRASSDAKDLELAKALLQPKLKKCTCSYPYIDRKLGWVLGPGILRQIKSNEQTKIRSCKTDPAYDKPHPSAWFSKK